MSPLTKPAIFFDEDTLDLDTWKSKQIADLVRGLLSSRPDSDAFIKLDEKYENRFIITLVRTQNEPLEVYEATIVDEDNEPQLKSWLKKE